MTRQLVRDFGTCLGFDGDGDSVSLGTFDPSAGDISISFWYKGYFDGTRAILSKRDAWDDATGNRWQLALNDSDVLPFVHFERWGGGINTSVPLDDGDWHHYLITHDYNTEIKVYKDNVLIDTLSGFEYGTKTDAGLFIGQNGQDSEYLKGKLDEVCIWSKILIQAEATSLFFGSSLPTAISDLECWYKFDEGSGNEAIDSSGKGRNGTITGATYSTDVVSKLRSVT